MKLLLDCSALTVGGGVQVGLAVIYRAVRDAALEVCLIVSEEVSVQMEPGDSEKVCQFHVFNSNGVMRKLLNSKLISNIEKNFRPDMTFVVFGPSYWRPKSVCLQGFALGKMLYPESRSYYRSSVDRWREQLLDKVKIFFFKRNSDCYLVETDVVKERLAKFFSIPLDCIYVIGNSYSPAFERQCLAIGGIEKSESAYRIFVPASFYLHKNLEVVPRVAAVLKERGWCDIVFVFTLDSNCSGWKVIEGLAADLGVSEFVVTAGAIPNKCIAEEYAKSDAVLCTSLVESSTAVFPEAFMVGVPLLVSGMDFARNLCGDAALYFDPHDPGSIADSIVSLFSDPKLQSDMIKRAKAQLRLNYPTPNQKWEQQRALFDLIVSNLDGN